ncbi:class I SAM-dependent methyltransferase [Pontibacillus sp. HMF3514]|uniref:class I SAM-dependent methyltransferase n=1 Tax=Pontibacillus sp. HMF3514 TaxID=2692425 RepID=UPI0013205715|nr:class I SAM-dependent methyltransferase [Pontibacillus sp. HMF3514]QHE51562.1 methyltransferase domain-containing protein [Pontibacillus sp. HMF3514]
MKKEKLIKKYDKHVKMYEKNLNNPTLGKWRSRLIKNAKGKVLEVGVGVGSNFPYYDKENVHVTGVDFSPEMIKSARQTARQYEIDADFIHEDVENLKVEPNSFDTVLSTLSLCSYPNPGEVLNKFNNWCEKDGTVLLMEHGLSSNVLLSSTQNVIDPLFKKVAGCHWNRNILEIVESSPLQVEHVERYWADMVYLIWAKPTK